MAPAPAPKAKIPVWGWALAALAFGAVFIYMSRQNTAAQAAPVSDNTPTQLGGGALTPDQTALYGDLTSLSDYLQANGLTPPAGLSPTQPGFLGPPTPAPGRTGGPVSSPPGSPPIPPLVNPGSGPPIGGTIIGTGPGPHPVAQ